MDEDPFFGCVLLMGCMMLIFVVAYVLWIVFLWLLQFWWLYLAAGLLWYLWPRIVTKLQIGETKLRL